MGAYILKFSACLGILLVFYKLFLEKESMHKFKRFYLLGAVLQALSIPLIIFTTVIVQPLEPMTSNDLNFVPLEFEDVQKTWLDYLPTILWSIYGLGVAIFGFKFFSNLREIHQKIKNNPKQKYLSFTNVLLKGLKVPHTFLNFIFLNRNKFESNAIPEAVFLHEQAHARQRHTLDILFVEMLQIVFWFNPLLIWLKRSIKLNHEYLADNDVLNQGVSPTLYQEILLAFSTPKQDLAVVNAINYASLKKRFTLMKTQTSKRRIWLKGILVLPLLAALVYGFSQKETVFEEPSSNTLLSEIKNNNEGATEAMMLEYKAFIIEFNKTRTITNDSYERALAIYDLMTESQKQSVEKLPELPFKMRGALKRSISVPTNDLLNQWKDKSKYAVWIDGKVIDNASLNNHKATDFVHYFQSKVYDNARSAQFPQPFQVGIYTASYYKANFLNKDVKEYKRLAKNYTNALREWLKGNRADNSELQILKVLADKAYKTLPEAKIKEFKLRPTPPLPAEKSTNKPKQQALKTVPKVEILLDKQNKLFLNGKPTKQSQLLEDIERVTANLTSEERQKHVNASIIYMNENQAQMVKSLAVEMSKANLAFVHSAYKENLNKEKDFYSPYSGLSLEESTKKQNQQKKDYNANPSKNSPWKVSEAKIVDVQKVTYKPESTKLYARSTEVEILDNDSYVIDGIKATKKTFRNVFNQLHQDISIETRKRILNIHVSSTHDIPKEEAWFIYNALQDYGFYRIVTPNQETNTAKGNTPFAIENKISDSQNLQDGATKEQMKLYNKIARHYNSMSKKNFNVKMKEVEQMKYIYGLMTDTQKKNAEPFPNLPEAPPPPKPPKLIKEQKLNKEKQKQKIALGTLKEVTEKSKASKKRNKGKVVEGKLKSKAKNEIIVEEMEIPPPPPPPMPENATEEQKKRYKKIIEDYAKKHPKSKSKVKTSSGEVIEVVEVPSELLDVPPPPPPPPPMDMEELAKEGAEFYYEGKKISSKKALELYKKNKELNVQVSDYGTGVPKVKISKEPIQLKRKN